MTFRPLSLTLHVNDGKGLILRSGLFKKSSHASQRDMLLIFPWKIHMNRRLKTLRLWLVHHTAKIILLGEFLWWWLRIKIDFDRRLLKCRVLYLPLFILVPCPIYISW